MGGRSLPLDAARLLSLRQSAEGSHTSAAACGAQLQGTANGLRLTTFIELEGHRAALKTALEKARYEVDCMEKYTAFDQRPLVRCLADVAAADVYVLLIAHRYGYRPPENNPQRRSITQLEYEEASRHGKPIKCSSTIRLLYVFVLGDRCIGGRDRCLN